MKRTTLRTWYALWAAACIVAAGCSSGGREAENKETVMTSDAPAPLKKTDTRNMPGTGIPPSMTSAPRPDKGKADKGWGAAKETPMPAAKTGEDSPAELRPATIVFNTPEKMELEEEKIVQLLLSERKTVAELAALIKHEGKKEGHGIEITSVMQAELKGQAEDFTITPITEKEQIVSPNSLTEWKWSVRAKSPGVHHIHLTLNRKLVAYGKERFQGIYDPAFDKIITVEVSAGRSISRFIRDNSSWLQWTWTAILLPVAGWLWNRRRKKRGT